MCERPLLPQASMATVLWQMCALGAAMWVAQYILTVALQTAAMRQVARIRTKVRRSCVNNPSQVQSEFVNK